jgi:toxin ParE1/3/4
MPTVTQREAARRDLVEHFVYLAENAGLDVTERFLTNAEASFNDLAQQPRIGAPLTLKHPDLANVRKWRVKDFDHHLVFYHRAPTAWPSCACCTPPAIGGACWAWQTSRGRPPSCITSPSRPPWRSACFAPAWGQDLSGFAASPEPCPHCVPEWNGTCRTAMDSVSL